MTGFKSLPGHGTVHEIGGSKVFDSVRQKLESILKKEYCEDDKQALPDELLYDDIGLKMWAEIIDKPAFYQTVDEIAIFDQNASEVIRQLEPGVVIIDLGAGDTKKVEHFLSQVEKAGLPATYLALDISMASLKTNIDYLVEKHPSPSSSVKVAGLWGTFEDGMEYIRTIPGPRLFLSLGSVLCNDPWQQANDHLASWAKLFRPADLLVVGMDGHVLPGHFQKIWDAYHKHEDLYIDFFHNGMNRMDRVLGFPCFRPEDWTIDAELTKFPYTRHRWFFRANKEIRLEQLDKVIKQGEEYDWFDSHKYDENDVRKMCRLAGLSVWDMWQAPGSEFRQYLIKTKSKDDPTEDTDSAVSGLD
jgi:EasF-like predicted methyltransferase